MKFNLHKTHPNLLIVFGLFVLVVGGGFAVINNKTEALEANQVVSTEVTEDNQVATAPSAPGDMDSFAKCLTEKGAKFYGAVWCSHCQKQKKSFGESIQYINYIECAIEGGAGQAPVCAAAGIQGYPTWQFSDGSEILGEADFQELSEKTNCPL